MFNFRPLKRSNATLDSKRYRSIINFMDNNNLETVEFNGQRVTTPRNLQLFSAPDPDRDCEIFIREIPRNIFEDELIPLFGRVGVITKFRLMLDYSGFNRGYAFVTYARAREAYGATAMLDHYEIRYNRHIVVYKSIDNCRLFMGGVPVDKTNQEIYDALKGHVDGLTKIIMVPAKISGDVHRDPILIEFVDHKAAALARRKLDSGFTLWDKDVTVDWVQPLPEVPEEIMSQVKNICVRNLPLVYNVSTIRAFLCEIIHEATITKIHRIKDYVCIHFTSNLAAEIAMNMLNNTAILGEGVEIRWPRPPQYLRFQRMDAPELNLSNAPWHAMNPTHDFGLPLAHLRRIVQQRRLAVTREASLRPPGR